MKQILLKSIILLAVLITPQISIGEVIQLKNTNSQTKTDPIIQLEASDLVEIQKIKITLIKFINSSNQEKQQFFSTKFKNIFKNQSEYLASHFDKESYFKIDIQKLEKFSPNAASAETILFWAFEGYEGVQTCHFSFVKENDQWRIDCIVM